MWRTTALMKQAGRQTRFAWAMGVLNGLLAIVIVNLTYTLLSSPGIWLVPFWLTVPYGAFTAWRASVFVRALLRAEAKVKSPLVEGFGLMAISAVAIFSPGVWTAYKAGVTGGIGALAVYAFLTGMYGALVAGLLVVLDLVVVRFWSPLHHKQAAS